MITPRAQAPAWTRTFPGSSGFVRDRSRKLELPRQGRSQAWSLGTRGQRGVTWWSLIERQNQHWWLANLHSTPIDERGAFDKSRMDLRAAGSEVADVIELENEHASGRSVNRGERVLRYVRRGKTIYPPVHATTAWIEEGGKTKRLGEDTEKGRPICDPSTIDVHTRVSHSLKSELGEMRKVA